MLMDICSPSYRYLQIVLRVTQILDAVIFFKKKVLPDNQSEIHLVRDVTSFLNKLYSGLKLDFMSTECTD